MAEIMTPQGLVVGRILPVAPKVPAAETKQPQEPTRQAPKSGK